MPADQVIQARLEGGEQKDPLRGVDPERGDAGMQCRRERNRQRRLQISVKPGIQDLRRRAGKDHALPIMLRRHLLDSSDYSFLLVRHFIQGFSVETQAFEIHPDVPRDE
ncbi:MAG: hypothetical protein HYY47_07280, partial [Deltaproteobacteria bacterium]|nr:hypothetical protein [Deltaproteobacteria bacterium]